MTFDDYVVADDRIDSVMILHRGKIAYQRFKTHGPLDRHMAWSVTKVFVSTALARLEAMGKVSMQATIKSNVPEFSDSAWGSLILQDVIDMTSGIDCRDSDGYQNTGTCVYRAEEVQNIVPQVQKNFLQPLPCQKVCRLIATQVKKQNIPPRIR
jgi:CubicO group peptidase (beta-lactamase class C family)